MLGKQASTCILVRGPLAESMRSHLDSRSVVAVDGNGRLAMHDLLRDMGRAIVKAEHGTTLQCSRIWMPDAEQALKGLQVWLSQCLCPFT